LTPVQMDGISWSLGLAPGAVGRSVLLGPGDALEEIIHPSGLYVWGSSRRDLRADVFSSDVRAIKGKTAPLNCERGTYQLAELIVMRRRDAPDGPTPRLQFDILVRSYPAQMQANLSSCPFRFDAPTDEELRSRSGLLNNVKLAASLPLSEDSWSRADSGFGAYADRINEWKITMPDELIKVTRQLLKANPSEKSTPAEAVPAADAW
jgi:hypothetical protein